VLPQSVFPDGSSETETVTASDRLSFRLKFVTTKSDHKPVPLAPSRKLAAISVEPSHAVEIAVKPASVVSYTMSNDTLPDFKVDRLAFHPELERVVMSADSVLKSIVTSLIFVNSVVADTPAVP
jgi:hypothetical protein